MKYNILLTGVGGQGLMLLSRIIGTACMEMNLKVVAEEQHGLAQRSGSITAHIRIGDVSSPVIPYGSADLILSMEAMESLRYIEFLKSNGFIISSSRILHPVVETNTIAVKRKEKLQYISLDQIKTRLRKVS
jgi:indolepyruvate ferredoxin oxidoreductase beta subunit